MICVWSFGGREVIFDMTFSDPTITERAMLIRVLTPIKRMESRELI